MYYGPEYISAAIQAWALEWGIRLEYIQPGNPQQNAYVERFNRTVRYEWLSQYYWSDLAEVQDFATKWMRKLPHQVDNSKLEIPVLNVLGMNSMGVLSPRESWGLNSL